MLVAQKGTSKNLGINQMSYAITACVCIYNLIQMRQMLDGREFAVLLKYISNFLKLQKCDGETGNIPENQTSVPIYLNIVILRKNAYTTRLLAMDPL
jgi:hypothetical protein